MRNKINEAGKMDRNKEFRRKIIEKKMSRFITDVVSEKIMNGGIFLLVNVDVVSFIAEIWNTDAYQLFYENKPVKNVLHHWMYGEFKKRCSKNERDIINT
jgi:hypothetical protein